MNFNTAAGEVKSVNESISFDRPPGFDCLVNHGLDLRHCAPLCLKIPVSANELSDKGGGWHREASWKQKLLTGHGGITKYPRLDCMGPSVSPGLNTPGQGATPTPLNLQSPQPVRPAGPHLTRPDPCPSWLSRKFRLPTSVEPGAQPRK